MKSKQELLKKIDVDSLTAKLRKALEESSKQLDPFYDAVKRMSDAVKSVNESFYLSSDCKTDGWHGVILKTKVGCQFVANERLFEVNVYTYQIRYNDGQIKQSSKEALEKDMGDVFMLLENFPMYAAWMHVW